MDERVRLLVSKVGENYFKIRNRQVGAQEAPKTIDTKRYGRWASVLAIASLLVAVINGGAFGRTRGIARVFHLFCI